MGRRRLMLVGIAVLVWAFPALSALYIWKDEEGRHHLTDRPDKLPGKFQALLQGEQRAGEDSQGLGYWLDESGNYHFYDKRGFNFSSPTSAPRAVTGVQKEWRGQPNPLVLEARVKDIISGDTILLEGGQKLKYIGIAFPEHLKENKRLHEEAKAYQRKMLKGRTVHILFDQARNDEKGRLLGFVFLGTNIFVNADLVMAGYAKVRTVPPNLEYRDLFSRLENFAKQNRLGIWQESEAP
jgi:endonuclease YncB( thermonuclease family)